MTFKPKLVHAFKQLFELAKTHLLQHKSYCIGVRRSYTELSHRHFMCRVQPQWTLRLGINIWLGSNGKTHCSMILAKVVWEVFWQDSLSTCSSRAGTGIDLTLSTGQSHIILNYAPTLRIPFLTGTEPTLFLNHVSLVKTCLSECVESWRMQLLIL